MKKFGFVIAALGALIIAAPSIASAQTVVIKRVAAIMAIIIAATALAPNIAAIATAATIADGAMVIATGSWSSRSTITKL